MSKKEEVREPKKERGSVTKGIRVVDPVVVKPKDLPLLITPEKGGNWANDSQAEFAQTLNGYAYKNPEKFAFKRDALIAQLADLAKNPEGIVALRGGSSNLSFKNEITGV